MSMLHCLVTLHLWHLDGEFQENLFRNQGPKGVDPAKIIWLFGLRKLSVQNGVDETPPVD